MKRITVYCGSNEGNDPVYKAQAHLLGKILAQRNIELVYGGARVGLMGAIAEGTLEEGGRATGVLPRFLRDKEIAHERLTELELVDTMAERKARIEEMADGIIALPGGYGTMDELFEALTNAQLQLHQKPIGLLNTAGFYDGLVQLLETMTARGLLKEVNRNMLLVSDNIDELLDQMFSYTPATVNKWIEEETN
ncbi:TIGR00730 family Rossman fold protein [Sinomicrobium weinanense]|uniref:Cytokinin riboside 5'-monophosphate phosphoribohydrolase n=1 Tax=Sinomicrobium weinanense TaxID=2842200 RepID=A0A926Q3Y5_9FLAO|nr:TIGR00730 family Rossman fold protein [Sinomicrobium weinanense]MBC9798053.1 TIGR00730 family Rossman fold protein [Sinomicrobium weinanense]MBU3124865.1 TIGR00730 family Rossman fold protein [Sinomicrobium weinanense]